MSSRIGLMIVLAACMSAPAHAVVVGANDWMQLTTTAVYSWDDIDAIFDTSTGQCDVAGCLLGGSINMTGYTWASGIEVSTMVQTFTGGTALSITSSDTNMMMGAGGMDNMFAAFNATETPASVDVESIWGFTRETLYGDASFADTIFMHRYFGALDSTEDFLAHEVHTWRNSKYGGWFYKSANVPEPATLALLSLGLAGLGFRRKKLTNTI